MREPGRLDPVRRQQPGGGELQLQRDWQPDESDRGGDVSILGRGPQACRDELEQRPANGVV